MAAYKRLAVAQQIIDNGVLPLFYTPDLQVAKEIVKACYDGGLRVIEFTNRGDFAHEVFGELNKYVLSELPGMIMGIGSVIDPGTASMYLQLGANFVLAPSLNPEVAKVCHRRKVLWVPGCATPSEISNAEELGAELVKVFPGAQLGGPGFVKAIKGPSPWTSIVVTGGVSPTRENLTAWFEAGATCVGMGSKLITKELLANKDYGQLTETVREVLGIIEEVRG